MLKAIILDDNPNDSNILNKYLLLSKTVEVVKIYNHPLLFLQEVSQIFVDVLFVDIDMPIVNGLEVIRSLGRRPAIVLTTAHKGYAPEGFELDVTDYLVKPFGMARLEEALKRVEKRILAEQALMSQQANKGPDLGTILIKTSHSTLRYPIQAIDLLESQKDYVTYYIGNEKIYSLDSLKRLEDTLPADTFIRVHRSFIVAKRIIKGWRENVLFLKNGMDIPIGPTYKQDLKKIMDAI